ncbi:MAG TPA: winged helix-turn-helix domain-containing protein [Bryobacteraceae bacterium]|nr:winged helix-turn-helix domain-containing protein [Bryobacteraceae bacterium]
MPNSEGTRKLIRFDSFAVDLHAGELRKLGVKIKLREQSFAILALLLEHPCEVVTREELRARLWPADVFVEFDNNLNTAVTRLREALGDSAEKPRYIETLPRRGYRFMVSVSTGLPGPEELRAGYVRLAVLPFDNLSGDPAQEYFSDGMTEELITELACIAPGRLGVIARTSAMRYKGSRKEVARIGRELNVDYVVEGSVRRADNRVRISAQLIKVSDRTHLWAKSYDSELRDVLKLQSDAAQAIARQIDVNLTRSAAQRTQHAHDVELEAYNAYLLGLHQFSRASPSSFEKAVEYFRLAIDRDPRFGPAYAKLAMAQALSAFFGYAPHVEAFPKAESAARRALEFEGSLTEAHTALGLVHWFHHWNLGECDRELERAVGLNPNDPAAHWTMAMFLGSMKEEHQHAAIEASLALSLDPLSIAIRSMTCWLPYWARHYDRAIAQARATLDLDENAPQAYYVLGTAARAKGDFDDAITALEQSAAKFGDPFSLAYLGMTYGLAGKHDRARAVLNRLEQSCGPHRVLPIFLAFIYAGLGENRVAIDHIEKAFEEHDALVLWLGVSPDWDSLRHEPRFQNLLVRLNLPTCRAT